MNKTLFSSNKHDWQTPKELFLKLNEEFNFDCDLFASDENALCDLYFTEKNSAFVQNWYNSNFANPPYLTVFKIKHLRKLINKLSYLITLQLC